LEAFERDGQSPPRGDSRLELVFERFTERARQVIVFAQLEARELGHGYLGTEHVLLGLLRAEEGLAARILTESFALSLTTVRADVRRVVGQGDALPAGEMTFTPRAKKVLELADREAISDGAELISSEHVLLGLASEPEVEGRTHNQASRILLEVGADAAALRAELVRMSRPQH
jgi:ATP-dependent Clp protease ATP-binding subunit ClpC